MKHTLLKKHTYFHSFYLLLVVAINFGHPHFFHAQVHELKKIVADSAMMDNSKQISGHQLPQKYLSNNQIWNGDFTPKRLQQLQALSTSSDAFCFLEFDKQTRETKIIKQHFSNPQKKQVVLSSKELPISFFQSFQLSKDETKVILGVQETPRYRYSKSGYYFVYDFKNKSFTAIGEQRIFHPRFSNDGQKIAYVQDANIYIQDLNLNAQIVVTTSGIDGRVSNGLADWAYEEEFELIQAFKWSPKGDKIAFLRFDTSDLKTYTMHQHTSDKYPEEKSIKYPKAGEQNSTVSLHIFDVTTRKTKDISLENYNTTQDYLPDFYWHPKNKNIVVKTVNRLQNHLQLLQISIDGKKQKIIYSETNTTYIDYHNHFQFLGGDRFLLTSEKSGFRQVYLCTNQGKKEKQLSFGDFEVTQIYGVDLDRGRVFLQGAKLSQNTQRHLYSISLDTSTLQSLTTHKPGTHKAYFSSDYSFFIDEFSSVSQPVSYQSIDTDILQEMPLGIDNTDLKNKLLAYNLPSKEFKTITQNGHELNYYIIKPHDFDANKKYPVLIYQYSGPGSQQVQNTWHSYTDYWHYLLTQKGYVIVCLDPRGTGMKGKAFKDLTYKKLGVQEAKDHIAFAEHLATFSFIDRNRVGIWGWSYGGTIALHTILQKDSPFKASISVAPVTHWSYYDSIYTERYMQTQELNPMGYYKSSPLFLADQLEGSLLLVHGLLDENVHIQNTYQMTLALNKAHKFFDLAIYPNANHGIYGGNTREHLFDRMTNFILTKL